MLSRVSDPSRWGEGIEQLSRLFFERFSPRHGANSHEWRPMPDFSSGIGFKINVVFLRFGS